MRYLIALTLFLLTACSGTGKPPYREQVNCMDDQYFQTEFARDGSEVTLITHRGQRVTLPSVPAAEGDLFSNGMTALIVHEDGSLMIEQDGMPLMTQCELD